MSDLSKTKPSKNYDLLRKQFSSLKLLAVSQESTISLLSKKDNSLAQIRLDKLQASLASEKEMNALLTAEGEKLEEENALLRGYKDLANERCQFIVNSVALGYCTLPDPETTDSAHNTYRRCNLVDSYAIEDLRKQNK
jgi:cell division protein FtsB